MLPSARLTEDTNCVTGFLLPSGVSEAPYVETGLRNFLMSQFPSSPKCLEKKSSANNLRAIFRPYFSKFISTNAEMRLECSSCRQEASNFWEHVYMMHLKVESVGGLAYDE